MSKEQSAHRGTLKRLIKELVRGNELHLAVVFVCIVIVAVANASMALFVKTLIDNYILPLVGQANPDFGPLAQILGVMATIYALGVLSNLLYARILVRVEQGTLKKLRDDMFEHMQKLPIRFFDTHQHGDIMSSIRTIQTCCVRLSLNQCLQSSRPLSLCSPRSSLCSI